MSELCTLCEQNTVGGGKMQERIITVHAWLGNCVGCKNFHVEGRIDEKKPVCWATGEPKNLPVLETGTPSYVIPEWCQLISKEVEE